MGLSTWLALKHLAKARRGGFMGRVVVLALAGVAVGVATLLTVFAFVQGFRTEVRELLTGMNPAVFVSATRRGDIAAPDSLAAALADLPGLAAAAPFVQQKGVLSVASGASLKLRGVILRGVDPRAEPAVTSFLAQADPPFADFGAPGDQPGLLVGARLAADLGVLPGETITFTTLLDESSREALHVPFFVLGTVDTGLHEFDRRFAYADIAVARDLFRAGTGVDGLGLRLDDVMAADAAALELRARLPFPRFQVASWIDLNGEIFRWMKTMRAVLFLVLCLIILVAGFNIAGAMTIIVTEKTREIGLLLSLGGGRRDILNAFLLEGWLIVLGGILAGGALALGLVAWFRDHPLRIPGEVYFIDHMPVEPSGATFAAIVGATAFVAFFALALPGFLALRRTPLDALRRGGGIRA